jgi:hypothetical protein
MAPIKQARARPVASLTAVLAAAAAVATALLLPAGGSARTTVAPRNTAPPTISGTPQVDETLRSTTGTWTGTQPIQFTFQWLRCTTSGENCVTLSGFTDDAYAVREGDIDHTLRVRVTARNNDGQAQRLSAPTAVVKAAAGPPGAIKLPNGETSIPVTSVPSSARLVVDRVDFSPNPVRSRETPITVRIKVKDTRNYVVRDALVFLRSTPIVTSTPDEKRTEQDGWVQYTVQPESDFVIRNGYSTQFYVKAFRQGDPVLAGVAGSRLVQVATAR